MNHEPEKKISKVKWPQWIAGIGVTILALEIGMMMAWSSPYIANLTSSESQIPMTMDMASWIVSLINLGRLIGAISGAVAMHYLGTKTTILIITLPLSLCWIFTIVANQVEWLYVARFLGGIGVGKAFSFTFYIGEIADPSIRGALVVLAMSGLSTGNLMMSIMGAYVNMEISASIALVFCIILMVIFIWLPESPHYFIKVKAEDKARASILWYHRDCDVESELQALKNFIEINNNLPFMDILKEFRHTHIWKAQCLVVVLFMYSQMSGMNNVTFYMETILRNAQVTVIEPAVVVIITTATGIVSSFLSMLLIDNFGRRVVMITASLNVSFSLFCLGTTFQLLDKNFNPANIQGLAIFSMLYFQVAVFIGIISVPVTVMGEIFPSHVKFVAGCFNGIIGGIFAFISTSTYQPLINLITEKYIFYIYALVVITAAPFTFFYMPETKGKTLQQIQKDLTKKN